MVVSSYFKGRAGEPHSAMLPHSAHKGALDGGHDGDKIKREKKCISARKRYESKT